MNTLKNQFLENLLLDELAEIYAGEQQIARAFSGMMKLASNNELKHLLKTHAYQTVGHISKVAQVFASCGEATLWTKGDTVGGLLAKVAPHVSQNEKSPAQDEVIIAAAQKVAHYEIATYTCLRDWARVLDNDEAATFLEEILDEEVSFDQKLADLAHTRSLDALEEAGWHGCGQSDEDEDLAHHGHGRGSRHPALTRKRL